MKFNKLLFSLALCNISFGVPGYENLIFHQTLDTLNTIKRIITNKEKGAYLRFGDGEIIIAEGQGAIEQVPNTNLAKEMQETLALNGHNILKTIPLYCTEFKGWEQGMFLPGNHQTSFVDCMNLIKIAEKYWGGPITDVYSHAALHFASTTYTQACVDFLKFLKKSNCALFVGNKNIPENIRNLLFGTNCTFIPTAPHSCYNDIDQIEQTVLNEIQKNPEYKVVVTCMGPAGKILQKRLLPNAENVFLFDFGSLMDGLCGWKTRDWIHVTHFNPKNILTLLKD